MKTTEEKDMLQAKMQNALRKAWEMADAVATLAVYVWVVWSVMNPQSWIYRLMRWLVEWVNH